MQTKKWAVQLSLTVVCLLLGLLLIVQLRTRRDIRQSAQSEEWEFVVADLVESNARLREEVETMQAQLAGLREVEGGGTMLQSIVDEVNHLRIANGLIEVSGPGVVVTISGPISILDLHDLVNELRNAGAEALALNGQRIVAWSAITTDGEDVTVDGLPVSAPYRLEAIGDAQTLEVALLRPGGLVSLLTQANPNPSIAVSQRQNLTLPVSTQTHAFAYARPQE